MSVVNRSAKSIILGFAFAAMGFVAAVDFSIDNAWAQERRGLRQTPPPPAAAPPTAREISRTPAAPVDNATPFGTALSSCDRGEEEDPQFALPGLKGDIKLDRCYRGRRHLVCRFDAVISEEKSLLEEFTRIVEQRYPELGNVEEICKRSMDSLNGDSAGAAEFIKRFAAARAEYDARTGCANKIKQSFQDVTLPDLVQAPEVLKSLMDSIDQEVNKVAVVQEQAAGLAQKMEVSQRSIGVLQKIHRAICLKDKNPVQAERPAIVN